MTKVIEFPDEHVFEAMSITERMAMIQSWNEEFEANMIRIRESAAAISAQIEAIEKGQAR